MAHEARFVTEALATVQALERFLPGVGPLVPDHTPAVEEAFATDRALIGSLSRVAPPVVLEVRAPTEALPTFRALIGSLSRVGPPVSVELRDPAKDLPTIGTLVRFFSRMGPPMLNKVRFIPETFPTHTAPAPPFPFVRPLLHATFVIARHLAAIHLLVPVFHWVLFLPVQAIMVPHVLIMLWVV